MPFLPGGLFQNSTLRFPEELLPEGRIRKGNATLVPNILPLDRLVGVAVFLSPTLRSDGRAETRNDE